jgi:radical SAM protein (TIGR01212 family)
VEAGREFLGRRYGAEGFILYFQAGTNTAADPGELKAAWDYGLSLGDFCGLAVATRPDCLSPAALDLLASYQTPGREVVVELGLQSAGDATLRRINRGHSRDDFARGWEALSRRGIPGVIHLILGLPGEGWAEMEETARWTAALRPFGVKLHNLHIPRLSPLFEEFLRGEATAPSPPRYLEALIRALERLPRETLILRLTADTPGGPAAPRRFWDKSRLDRELKARMEDRKTWQGRLCPEGPKILSKEIE